jgi:glycosyltransferase involved in cell wall biosynthesis
MNILLSTPVFYPMVGGMETVAENLASLFSANGSKVTVVTPVMAKDDNTEIYKVVRNPGFWKKIQLAKESDIIFSNGASLYMLPFAILTRKPFIWKHCGYQAVALDGLGWYKNQAAPLSPLKSFWFHLRNNRVGTTIRSFIRVVLIQLASRYYVKTNIVISKWMSNVLHLPRQIHIYEPFFLNHSKLTSKTNVDERYDFFFLGRLVSEKGVDVLLKAFSLLVKDNSNREMKLAIIGDGPERQRLIDLSKELNIQDQVFFLGVNKEEQLLSILKNCNVGVIPSVYEEPLGGVAIELIALQKNLIVSRFGGLAEIVGNPDFTFENGNYLDLKNKLYVFYTNPGLLNDQLEIFEKRMEDFCHNIILEKYLSIFKKITGK